PGVLRSPDSGRVFWAYQDSFRGPYRPGDPEFEQVVDARLLPGETRPREILYCTTITLNDDPGRGLKYLGSLLIVLGTAFLIYRQSGKNATMNDANATNDKQTISSGKTIASTLAFLAAFLFASATFAQDAPKTHPGDAAKVATSTNPPNSNAANKNFAKTNAALDWNAWRRLPVFADGRRQPLDAFARILVRDVCGSPTPIFAVPEETLTRLESGKPLNFPTLEEVLKEVEPEKRAERTAAFNEISAGVVERQRKIAAKIRATFPNGARRFEAPELLFSWIVEPEIWDYIPFIDDTQAKVSQGVFALSESEIASRFQRLAPEDFERLDEKSGRLVVDNFRSTAEKNSPKIAKALSEAERRLTLFRSVSFIPTQSQSTRPSRYLQRVLYGAPTSTDRGALSPAASPLAKLDAATRNLERLISTTDKDLRKQSPFSDGDFLLRQTETFSQNGRSVEALKLAKVFYLLEMQNVATPTPVNGERLESLTVSVGDALSQLRTHRDAIFAAGAFSTEYRRELLVCVDALSEIADLLELAYLSTTSELPKTLDLVPVVRRREFRLNESQESPWVPLQTLLWAPDALLSRFVEPSLAPELQRLTQTPTPLESTPRRKRETPPTIAEQTISPFATFDEALRKTIDLSVYERPASEAFLEAALAYRDVNAPNRAERFNAALDRFAAELRSIAERSEPFRVALASEEVADERLRTSFLTKTSYPESNALDAELLYNRLNPFYWNWVACLFAVVAFAASYCRQTFVRQRRAATTSPNQATKEVADNANFSGAIFEERFFFVVGFAFLVLSSAVAFLGGAIRAYITGWAPVTNMFETVVLLAFLIATIAIGYALFPAWGRPFANAWRVSAFPELLRDATESELRVSRLLRWPRIVTIVLCVGAALRLCYHEEMFESGDALTRVILESFAMQGILDCCAILGTFFFIAWSVPRFLTAVAALVFFPKTTLCRDDLLAEYPTELHNIANEGERRAVVGRLIASQIVQRKALLTASSVVALLVAAAAYFNSSEFNPNIRPLAAVLRSNFWLTIHVFAIIVSYALGAIAWIVALTSLTSYIFGRYHENATSSDRSATYVHASKRRERRRARKEGAATLCNTASSDDWEPAYCRRVSSVVATMIRSAVLFLTIGIILGARWADFSWGRFWSWDPKEVWALVTLLIYLVVLHVLKVKRCGRFGLTVGATLGALAIVMTWYGLSFVMGGGGRHSYATGESNKVAVLYLLFAANLLWTLVATIRYQFEKAKHKINNGKR
ncbi:MAG: cytochrome c biogenesis protein CcsA, partial [Thermoguttaceae bacterium]|nr:cytochrome c biogenesis protein CcsA [Thermoguttaceae bacterium]